MLNKYLSKNNYNTSIARDGINGIKLTKEINPDLVILDIDLIETVWGRGYKLK